MRGQDAAVLARARLLLCFKHDRARAIAEQHAGGAVVPVEDTGEGLGSDHQRARELARADEAVGGREPIDEARAYRLHVESRAAGHAELGLNRHGARRKGPIGGRGREHDEINRLRIDLGGEERGAGRVQGHVRGGFAGRRDPSFVDAGALHDPLVGGIDGAREFRVGEHPARQVAAAAQHDGAEHRHE
jgi:hypothetical protein